MSFQELLCLINWYELPHPCQTWYRACPMSAASALGTTDGSLLDWRWFLARLTGRIYVDGWDWSGSRVRRHRKWYLEGIDGVYRCSWAELPVSTSCIVSTPLRAAVQEWTNTHCLLTGVSNISGRWA